MRARFALTILLLALAAPAAAQQTQCPHEPERVNSPQLTAARQQMHAVCASDIEAYCRSRPACVGVTRCLEANAPRLSPACSGALGELRAIRRQTVP